MKKPIHFVWENQDSSKNRVLHIFGDLQDALSFIKETDGLREWNPWARYFARDSEVVNHDSNLVISHTG